jgi:hypothetical protein
MMQQIGVSPPDSRRNRFQSYRLRTGFDQYRARRLHCGKAAFVRAEAHTLY